MLGSKTDTSLSQLPIGTHTGTSPWVTVTQAMIDGFAAVTLDPDPMHVDPAWARANGPFGGTIAFGFLTISLLTHLLHTALSTDPNINLQHSGYYLNYGFDRLRLVSPVRCGQRIRGRFDVLDRKHDERQRLVMTIACTIDIEGEERPALSAYWLTIWVPSAA